jgi:ribonuclease D
MNEKNFTPPIFDKARFPGEIVLVEKDEHVSRALELLNGEHFIGFDTETKPSFKKGEFYHVSLLQLASPTHALLFRLHSINDFTLIKSYLEDEAILKIGVAIRDDLKSLQKLFDFTPKGFIELSDLARENNLKNFGLKGMTEEVLNLTLSKKAKLSNWESKILNFDQRLYAATDAWIGREIYLALKDEK